jgi:hypothetical protein
MELKKVERQRKMKITRLLRLNKFNKIIDDK